MKQLFGIVFLFLVNTNIFSQMDDIYRDYIITLDNDTIVGEIHKVNEYSKIKFNDGKNEKTLNAGDIAGYKKGINTYLVKRVGEHPFKLNTRPVFVSKIVSGYISVYALGNPLLTDDVQYYLEKDTTITKADNIEEYFKDYEVLANSIRNKCFTIEDIPEIVRIYNEWCKNKINVIPTILQDKKYKGYSPGYVIEKVSHDTIYGYVKWTSMASNYVHFFDSDLKYREYNITYGKSELIGFSINKKYYKNLKPNKKMFIREFIQGEINLYGRLEGHTFTSVNTTNPAAISKTTSYSKMVYYLVKETDEKPIKVKKLKLANYFKENKTLYEKIYFEYYDISDLDTIVSIYNNTSEM